MLYDIHKNKTESIPYLSDYKRWREQLSEADYEAIISALHQMMDEKIKQGRESGKGVIFNSSYIPGADWEGTPYLPIWEACGRNEETAKLFYGLLVWKAVMTHSSEWVYIRQESTGDKPIGLTYFERRR